jgi:hypothetical protein
MMGLPVASFLSSGLFGSTAPSATAFSGYIVQQPELSIGDALRIGIDKLTKEERKKVL